MRCARILVLALGAAAIGCGDDTSGAAVSGGSGGGAAGTGNASGGSGGDASGSGGGGATGGSAGQGGAGGALVDATTIEGKLLMGYQGWFACPGDGAPPDRWIHWFGAQVPEAQNLTVDLWPDLSELDPDELFPTSMTYADQNPASLYSAWNAKTVARHFQWMKDAGLDGVFLQRFGSELSDPAFLALRNKVAENVRAGAEAHGRVFAIMLDVSGQNEASLVTDLENDWIALVDGLKLTESPSYLREGGKPVLAIWGLGFADRPGTAAQAQQLVDWFESGADAKHQVTLVGGVPRDWRTLGGDSKTDAAWATVYRSFDVISPWTVGAFADEAGADAYATGGITPDLAEAKASGAKYMPVVFPGFSWNNLTGGPLNQIPRNGGAFYWRQAYNAVAAGSTLVYGAMFDEVDEGTAMFKIAPTSSDLPVEGSFVPLDADGIALPSDWYLRLAGEATRMVRGDLAPTPSMPIAP